MGLIDGQFRQILERGVNGFFGASSVERLTTGTAIEAQARRVKAIRFSS